MKRIWNLLVLGALSTGAMAQTYNPELNAADPRTFGEAVHGELTSDKMEKEKIAPVPVEIAVMLKKPIVMGCQYIYRVTNKSTDRTVKLKMYAVLDQQYEEKIKPGASVDLLANTMSRCGATKEEKKGEKGCINCQPGLTITEITVK